MKVLLSLSLDYADTEDISLEELLLLISEGAQSAISHGFFNPGGTPPNWAIFVAEDTDVVVEELADDPLQPG